jgi:hypothetical protein
MERQKFVKRFTLVAVALASTAFVGSSVVGLWQLAQAPVPLRTTLPSQDAQAEAQENSALAVLKSQPSNEQAIKSLEAVVIYYDQKRNRAKAISSLEKLQQAAPDSPNASQYKKVLAQFKQSPSPSPAGSPPATSPTPKSSK